jgi:crotonobetainyl-CoA:carnitine CoA-transferase CaiB-like acyl-CoA transferase
MHAINRPDLTGPKYQHNHHRVERQPEIERGISEWTSGHSVEEVEETMRAAGVPVGRVVSVKEIVEGEHVRARGAVRDVRVVKVGEKEGEEMQGWSVKMQGTFPVLDGVDPQPRWAGPDLGAHTEEVLTRDLGLTLEEVSKLRSEGVIG